MINEQGGIYGRELKLVAERDDKLANNQTEVQALLSQDNVFAVLPIATLLFTGADTLASSGTPTFGWNINPECQRPTATSSARAARTSASRARIRRSPGSPAGGAHQGRPARLQRAAVVRLRRAASRPRFEKWPTAEVVFKDNSLTFGTTDFACRSAR